MQFLFRFFRVKLEVKPSKTSALTFVEPEAVASTSGADISSQISNTEAISNILENEIQLSGDNTSSSEKTDSESGHETSQPV